MKSVKSLLVLTAIAVLCGGAIATAAAADNLKATFLRLDQPLEVGATTLQPGVYMVKVLPGVNRNELQVTSEDGTKTITTVLAIPQPMVTDEQRRTQFVYYPAGGTVRVLKTWYAPNAASGTGYDIIYPEARATTLAVAAGEPVIFYKSTATSPGWLTAELQTVGPDKKIALYVVPASDLSPMTEEPTQVAQNDNDVNPPAATSSSTSTSDELPRTASQLPLYAAVGILLLLAAGVVRFFRI